MKILNDSEMALCVGAHSCVCFCSSYSSVGTSNSALECAQTCKAMGKTMDRCDFSYFIPIIQWAGDILKMCIGNALSSGGK